MAEEPELKFRLIDQPVELTEQVNKDYNSRGNRHNRKNGKPIKFVKDALGHPVEVNGESFKDLEHYFKKQKIEVLGYAELTDKFNLFYIVLLIVGLLILYFAPTYSTWGYVLIGLAAAGAVWYNLIHVPKPTSSTSGSVY
jgi:hypothetical protein